MNSSLYDSYKTLRVFEAFAGYGSQSLALRNLGVKHEVVAISEIDKYALQAYYSLHSKEIPNLGDISKLKVEDIPKHDLFTYSFPCQDISVAGKQAGIEKGQTRSGLLYECERIIEHCKPKYLLMENVKNLVGKKFKTQFDEWLKYLEGLGYTNYYDVLNAKNYGIPQNRERVFVISILGEHMPYDFPKPFKLEKRLKDFLEGEVEEKYYLSEEIQKRFKPTKVDNGKNNIIGTTAPKCRSVGQRDRVYGQLSVSPCLNSTDYKQPKQIIDYAERLGGCFDEEKTKHQAGSVWNKEGISPTIDTMQGGYRQPLVTEEIKIEKVGNLECKGWHEIETRVHSIEGVAPTVETRNRAKYLEVNNKEIELPCIAASRGRNPENPNDRTVGSPTQQRLEINTKGTSNTITTVQKDNYVIEISDKENFIFNPSGENVIGKMGGELWEKRHEQSRRVYDIETVSPTIPTCLGGGIHPKILENQTICEQRCDEGLRFFKDNICGTIRTIDSGGDKRVIENNVKPNLVGGIGEKNFGKQYRQGNRIYDGTESIDMCLNAQPVGNAGGNSYLYQMDNFRIRKLTPRECFRLMGMNDNDIDKIQNAGISNSQQYKMAGNSIVINVLEEIFRNLFL